jgi:hypothetical protein
MDYIIVTKGGYVGRRKGATGPVWHAVAGGEINGVDMRAAMCNAQPAPRSYGWTSYGEPIVTCPKCREIIANKE